MPDRETFLRAIAANPADNTTRLVFADWLDEHDDPGLAEFIRLQVRLGDADRQARRYAKFAARERQLLNAHRKDWLGPLANAYSGDRFDPTFRRGFVAGAVIHGRTLLNHATALAKHCPVLEGLDVVGVRGLGSQIANAACLETVRTLRLEDWPLPADAKAIASSEHLSRLEHLGVWLGSKNDRAVCRALGASKNLPALRRVELTQLFGGMQAGDEAPNLAARADRMAEAVNSVRGERVAAVARPFEARFPLGPNVGRELYGGVLPDGRQVLAHYVEVDKRRGPCNWELFYFDTDGRLTGAERVNLSDQPGTKRPFEDKPRSSYYRLIVELLWGAIGFTPATIGVREFDSAPVLPDSELVVYKFGGSAPDVFVDPDGWYDRNQNWEESLDSVRYWLRSGVFVLTPHGSECWADDSGRIIAT